LVDIDPKLSILLQDSEKKSIKIMATLKKETNIAQLIEEVKKTTNENPKFIQILPHLNVIIIKATIRFIKILLDNKGIDIATIADE
jgi:hypothetical protein